MEIKILNPLWGHDHLPADAFVDKTAAAGYDGIDTWVPENKTYRHKLYDSIATRGMTLVTQQYRAKGSTPAKFRQSFIENLQLCAEPEPLLINSHTGKDYFSIQEYIDLIEVAEEFSAKTGIPVAHETHRGRLGYHPAMMIEIFKQRSKFNITADLSHWVCVTESMLENFESVTEAAIQNSIHVHARIGFEQSAQVSDPRAPEYKYAVNNFLGWWDKIVASNAGTNREALTFTTEFGPVPYMPVIPYTNKPLADQFEVNVFMKDLLRERYRQAV